MPRSGAKIVSVNAKIRNEIRRIKAAEKRRHAQVSDEAERQIALFQQALATIEALQDQLNKATSAMFESMV